MVFFSRNVPRSVNYYILVYNFCLLDVISIHQRNNGVMTFFHATCWGGGGGGVLTVSKYYIFLLDLFIFVHFSYVMEFLPLLPDLSRSYTAAPGYAWMIFLKVF